MDKKTIYLIRHGETDFNRQGIVQGSGVDSALNALGQAQAKAFFESYQHIPFHKVYISNLKRTKQSVQGFIDLGIPTESYAGLNEISWGEKEGKIPNSDDNSYFKNLTTAWRNGNTKALAEGGESPEDVVERQKSVMNLIISRPEESLILLAMHGRAIRILLTQLLNKPLFEMDDFDHSNLCLYKLIYSYETKKYTLEVANDTSHLLLLEV